MHREGRDIVVIPVRLGPEEDLVIKVGDVGAERVGQLSNITSHRLVQDRVIEARTSR